MEPIPQPVKVEVAAADEEIVRLVNLGEHRFYEMIIRRYNQRLYRIARGMNIPDADCDDLIQQTYISAFENLKQFRGESRFSTWLTRILINHCLMFKRKPKRHAEDTLDLIEKFSSSMISDLPGPDDSLFRSEMKKLLEEAIGHLQEEQRIVYVMRELEGLSVKETSECLGLTESNVKVRLHRAKAALRTYLERYMKRGDIFEFGNHRCDCVVANTMALIQKSSPPAVS
jgi:RNA polymerase sigma-70 factor (ECF subfamily)